MTKAKKPIPDFKNRQEMAEWFDTHDMTEYDFQPVKVRFAKNLSAGLNIRLDPASLHKLRTMAHKKGIGPTTQARMWIMEHLNAAH
jgi:predicted DNA binding CopG/RHH family protein